MLAIKGPFDSLLN